MYGCWPDPMRSKKRIQGSRRWPELGTSEARRDRQRRTSKQMFVSWSEDARLEDEMGKFVPHLSTGALSADVRGR